MPSEKFERLFSNANNSGGKHYDEEYHCMLLSCNKAGKPLSTFFLRGGIAGKIHSKTCDAPLNKHSL